MQSYQVKLTPVDSFFFGGEKHDEDMTASYYVESNSYPQQTTLLGLMRYYLLLKNNTIFDGKRIINREKAETIIGAGSFDFRAPLNQFGLINSISPLYFTCKDIPYHFAPMDLNFEISNTFQLIYQNENYNAKDYGNYIALWLTALNGDKIKLDDIISSSSQTGNEKAEKGESKEKKFYKQVTKRLADNWSFCVDIEIAERSNVPDQEMLFIPFGGEKSFFKLEIRKKEKSRYSLINYHRERLLFAVCISDCFANSSVLDNCAFAVNNFVSFRNLKSEVKTTNRYSGLSASDRSQLTRSSRFNLLQRGSVLYFTTSEKLEAFKKEMSQQAGYNIGFNHIYINN